MTFKELFKTMCDFNKKHDIKRKVDIKYNDKGEKIEMIARVVFKNNVFPREYPIEQRTYTFSNYNKALCSDDMGYSIFAYCDVDGTGERVERCSNNEFEQCDILSINE